MQLYTDVSGIFSQANHEFEDVQLLLRHTKTQMISDVLSILSTDIYGIVVFDQWPPLFFAFANQDAVYFFA